MEMFHLEKKDLWDELDDVLTVGDFYNRADEDGTQIIFV